MILNSQLQQILSKAVGDSVVINSSEPMGGGLINDAFKIITDKGNFFLKTNTQFPGMFEKEALGLGLLADANVISTPEVVSWDDNADFPFLLLKFIEQGYENNLFWETFGKQLASLHKKTSSFFGLDYDNYIGSLVQSNEKHDNWLDFFIIERLDKQLKLARDNNLVNKQIVSMFERYYNKVGTIFPMEKPALLHGDLWSGNFLVDTDGMPVIIDPAVYFGHREMDLAMTKLFGGFSNRFYESYNKHFELEPGWEERVPYCNLYPLMVHVNLFGGNYVHSVASIISKF